MTKASESAPCCGNCRYGVGDRHVGGRHGIVFTCKRYAPKPDGKGDITLWPYVSSNDWCGEWEPEMGPDSGPPVSLQDMRALADFMAHTGATPLFDGFDGPTVPPSPDAPPATAKPEFLTYDEPLR